MSVKTFLRRGVLAAAAIVLSLGAFPALPASAGFNQNNIISDSIFSNKNTMTASQINTFFNQFNNSCISPNNGFQAPLPTGYSPSGGFTFGANVTAGEVIYAAAQAYDLNPQILIATLQKEQALVTGASGCTTNRYAAAMGYGCPGSPIRYDYSNLNLYTLNGVTVTSVTNTCVNSSSKAGFSQQIIRAAWLLKFAQERSRGNIGWAIIRDSWDNSDDPESCYSGPMTRGYWQVCPSGPTTYYDGYRTIAGTAVFMGSGATAALYWYTPELHGNELFVNVFENWFGSTNGACYDSSNIAGKPSGRTVISNSRTLSFTRLNNTGSTCVEVHTWQPGYGAWDSNISTNLPSQDPANKEIITADTNGDGKDEVILVKYQSGSGKVEIHTWDDSLRSWRNNIATNLHNVNPANAATISADTDGNGREELHLIKYQSGSGYVEVHTWAEGSNYSAWSSQIRTNLPNVDPEKGRFVAGNILGDSRDELMYVKYTGTGSGKVEIHTWAPGFRSWMAQYSTNVGQISPDSRAVIAGDVWGDDKDEIMYVRYTGTGSGKVEIHTWAPGFKNWQSNVATNLTAFDPTE